MALLHSEAMAHANATTRDILNERDASKRRQLMEKNWSANVIAYEPGKSNTGYENIAKSIDELHAGDQSSWTCKLIEPIWVSHNLVHVDWEFGPGGKRDGGVGIRGKDILMVGKDGKVDVIYVMIEGPNTVESGN